MMSEVNTPLPEISDEDRAWLFSMLKVGQVSVTFTKTDGTERVMRCTLQKGIIPEREKKETITEDKEQSEKPKNNDLMFVWDLDKDAWRSFKLSTIKAVKVDN
jgi:hypothetical protein